MTQIELREILSSNIKFYRKRLFLTQEKLAEKTGLSAQTINDIEGCRTWVSDKSLIKIAEALHISPADLLIEHRDKNSSIINITSSDIYKLKKELKDTFLDSIESIFIKYTNFNE
ncbi:MAG: helix-turn-helix transcriptional regulator [Treponemataceae bacterium]|nr:helix-turn-helix transcriptional regulator [Treponemataceae bacterium]